MNSRRPDSCTAWLLWMPALVGAVSLMLVWTGRHNEIPALLFFLSFFIPAYLLVLSIVWAIQRSGAEVSQAIGVTVILSAGLITVMTFSISENVLGLGSDNFSKPLSLPEGVHLYLPSASVNRGGERDAFSTELMASLQTSAKGTAKFTAEIPNFSYLAEKDPLRLVEYLSASPSWPGGCRFLGVLSQNQGLKLQNNHENYQYK